MIGAWRVFAGREELKGKLEQTALETGKLVPGFGLVDVALRAGEAWLGSLSYNELLAVMRREHPAATQGTITRWTNQFWGFIHDIEVGDVVVMPRRKERLLAIGTVTGEYEFDPELGHYRMVDWIDTEVSRKRVSEGLKNRLGTRATVTNIGEYAEEIRKLLTEDGLLGFDVSHRNLTSSDLEMGGEEVGLSEQTASQLWKK